jgi:hypothetical protein
MVFSLLRPIAGLEKPSQDNAEYINPTISIWPSPIASKTTSVGHYDKLDIRNLIPSSELGSIATCAPYLSEPELRCRIRRGLLKVEQGHAFARDVF